MLMHNRHLKGSLGFTYIGLMLIVAIAGIALSGVGIVWKTEMQRENEKELRFVGQQYVAAIASYYECKVCGPNQLPKTLKDLLKDSRAPSVVHHIRKLYRDPMTRSNDWGLIKNGGRIMGVYSKSKLEPLSKPYDLDLFKKKHTTQSGKLATTNQTNTSQNNFNQVNTTQGSVTQAGGNNSNNNAIGTNVAVLNKSDTSKTISPIKPKKPSYQDWQFVYSGAGQATVNTSTKNTSNNTGNNVVSGSSGANISANNPSAPVITEPEAEPEQEPEEEAPTVDAGLICDEEFTAAGEACNKTCQGGVSAATCNACFKDAKQVHDECRRNLSGR